jgi:ribosomal protein S19
MTRSQYKPFPFTLNNFQPFTTRKEQKYKSILLKSSLKKKADLVCIDVSAPLYPSLIGRRVLAYNGRIFIAFLIRQSMVGLKTAHLIRSKRLGHLIHVIKKKKKKKK